MPPLTKRQKWELRRKKRGEVEQCYREHMPPQVRHLRWLKRTGQDKPVETPGAFGPGTVFNPAVFGDSPQRRTGQV